MVWHKNDNIEGGCMEDFVATLGSLMTMLPVLMTWIIGIILAIVFWKKHPAVSALTLIAFSGFMALSVLESYLRILLPRIMLDHGPSVSNTATIFILISAIFSSMHAVFWAILIIAIFGWRKKDPESVLRKSE